MTENPFCSAAIRPGACQYHFFDSVSQPTNPSQIFRCLLRNGRGSVVGPHGTGKSTLLHCLVEYSNEYFVATRHIRASAIRGNFRDRWKQRTQVFQHAMESLQELVPSGGLLVVDGAEQLLRIHYLRLVQACSWNGVCLLVTSHRPLPLAPTVYRTQLDADRVRSLTKSVVAFAPLDIQQRVDRALDEQDLERVQNLRDYWFDLYDLVQPHLTITPSPAIERAS